MTSEFFEQEQFDYIYYNSDGSESQEVKHDRV